MNRPARYKRHILEENYPVPKRTKNYWKGQQLMNKQKVSDLIATSDGNNRRSLVWQICQTKNFFKYVNYFKFLKKKIVIIFFRKLNIKII